MFGRANDPGVTLISADSAGGTDGATGVWGVPVEPHVPCLWDRGVEP